MHDFSRPQDAPEPVVEEDRRSMPRFFARAKALVFRESDALREGINGKLHDISIAGLGLILDEPSVDLLETIKIRLANEIQRFERDVRGVVRHITPTEEGGVRVGIELMTRLTPLEVSLLKMTAFAGDDETGSSWV